MIDSTQLRFVRLDLANAIPAFVCGNLDLEHFIAQDAQEYQTGKLSTTYLCFYRDVLVGYVSWVADCIRLADEEKTELAPNKARLQEFPAIKIARLAVQSGWQKQGIGSFLIRLSLGHMMQLSEFFGCRFATVDAKTDALGFYEKHGFVKNLHKQEKSHHTLSMRFDLLHYPG